MALVHSAAILNESLRLSQENMVTLRSLGQRTHAKPELFERIGKLCAGKHPAAATLKAARNKLGFHWDAGVIATSIRQFERNEAIVWIESDDDGHPIHRLASDVLVDALMPTAGIDAKLQQQELTAALDNMSEAMNTVIEFFTACTYGYFRVCSADRYERSREEADLKERGGD